MIVTCEECSTSFQLDEARIPASGAQVRCSRCKHAFFLANPTASQSEVTDAIAEEATHDPMSSVPPAIADVADPSSTVGAAAASPEAEAEAEAEPEEDDWQFSEEIRNEDDEELEPESDFGVSEDFGGALDEEALFDDGATDALDEPDSTDSGIAIDSAVSNAETGSGLELESEPEPLEPARDESNFGTVDDFSSLMEDDDVAPEDLGTEIEAELQSNDAVDQSASVHSDSGETDDLGDPESWDLVGSHDFTASKPAAGSTGARFQDDAAETGTTVEDDVEESAYEEEIGPRSPVWQGLARVGRGVGWAFTLGLAIGTLGLGLSTEWSRLAQSQQTVSVGALTAETTRASWVETSRSGSVLVVAGQIQNIGSVAIWPGRVQLALLDAAGTRLDVLPIQAGAPISEAILREASPDQLRASVQAAALRLHETPLEPGESRLFEATLIGDRLPDDAGRVLLEIGNSRVDVEFSLPVQLEEESEFSP